MPIWTKASPRRRIGILLLPRFSNLCLAHCVEPLRAANTLNAAAVYEWQLLGQTEHPVASSSGIDVLPSGTLDGFGACDELIVLASYGYAEADTSRLRASLRRAAARATGVTGFESGPWLMASAGLLDGRRATIHHDLQTAFSERFDTVTLDPRDAVRDGDRMTCVGGLAAYDLTRTRIVADLGERAGVEIDALFQTGQRGPVQRDRLMTAVMSRMRDSFEVPLRLEEIAAGLGLTSRTLDRRCRAALGVSPGRLYRDMRLARARDLLEAGQMPVAEVAIRAGYENAAAFARAYRARYGQTPKDTRSGAPRESLPSAS